jgi:YgiT-type zinc finger domain-containing protein
MKDCYFCKGNVEARTIEHIHKWGGQLYLFRNVPAEVCTQCGEVYFGPEALEAMDTVVLGKVKPKEHVSVPVYSLS